jgi:hypothetical protein
MFRMAMGNPRLLGFMAAFLFRFEWFLHSLSFTIEHNMAQSFRWMFGFLATACLLTETSNAWAQELSFRERYALSENRQALLDELIPDTDPYFYYHCLHAQTTGKIAEARGFLEAWIAKAGLNDQTRRMQTRQFLLEYSTNPQATLRYLVSEFGINIEHPAPRRNEAAELATQLDPKLIQWNTVFQSYGADLNRLESIAWANATQALQNPQQLRQWLERVERPDTPKLIDLVERELKMQDSRGFGWANIHQRLSESQLLDLQKRIPKLTESNAFVQARLRRIRPTDDASLDDPDTLRSHLDALEKFAISLPESQNSLKANILYRRLELDERFGIFDRERFMRYLALPISRPFVSPEYAAKSARRVQADLNANYLGETALRPILQDQRLIHRYLEHFAVSDASMDAFAVYLDRDFLRRTFAIARILQGVGDAKTQYAQLSPDEQRELQARMEVEFDVSNVQHFKTADTVQLKLNIKNVPEVLLKIYRINARNLLALQKRNVSTDIDLDGLVANLEKRLVFSQPADRRHREVVELPELAGGGVWVVDAIAGGMRSRAMIHKGHLHALQSRSDGGDVLRIFDADGKHVPTAKALYGSLELEPNASGEIIVPFAREAKADQIILIDGPVATLQHFHHSSENYSLQASFVIDPQSLLSGALASMVIRSDLLCNGELISLAQLEKPTLTITATDRDGVASTQTIASLALSDSRDLVQKFVVPPRLASLQLTLSGEVLLLSTDTRVALNATHSVSVLDQSRSNSIHDFFLSQTDRGYFLEVRGRNGEPAARMPVQFEFKLYGLAGTTSVRLATNEQGSIALGSLPDVQWFKVSADSLVAREFPMPLPTNPLPHAHHAILGEAIEFAVSTNDARPELSFFAKNQDAVSPARYSLIEMRADSVYAIHSDKVQRTGGLIRITALQPGNYQVTDHASGQTVRIVVVAGQRKADAIVGENRIVDTNRVRPVHIESVSANQNKLDIQIGNHDPLVRLHLVANAFVPPNWLRRSLPAPAMPLSSLQRIKLPSYYLNSMKLDEEYQYVLQRQLTKKYLGSLLPHPSALLTPWEIASTQNSTKDAAGGEAVPENAPAPAPAAMADPAKRDGDIASPQLPPDYEFLKRGSVILDNLACDATGKLTIDRKLLQGLTSVSLIVVHPSGTVSKELALSSDDTAENAPKREFVDLRLPRSFPAKEKWMQAQSVRILKGNDKQDLGPADGTRVQSYRSIAEVFQLYRTMLKGSADFDKLECLSRWGNLKDEEKEVFYSDLECHEVNLFLWHHDQPFFQRVVRPFLTNKMQKQFIDDYLLERDLSKYAQPWRLEQLNTFERILLAKRMPNATARTQRWMRDWIAAHPLAIETSNRFFSTALEKNMILLGDHLEGVEGEQMLRLQLERDVVSRFDAFSINEERQLAKQNQAEFYFDMDFAIKEQKARDEPADKKMEATAAGILGGRAFQGNARRAKLGKGVRLFEPLETTRKWAESNYFHLPLSNQNAALIPPNDFWLDYLNHSGTGPFLSKHLDQPHRNVHEAILALAVLGMPLNNDTGKTAIESNRIVANDSDQTVVFIRGLETIPEAEEKSQVLANQTIVLASEANTAETANPSKALVKSTVYRSRLVLTNPTPIAIQLQILRQIPQGAIPLQYGKATTGETISLAPFATQELSSSFYFPSAGEFTHYGAQIAKDGKSTISIPSTTLRVLDAPESNDEASWSHVALWGSNEQVLAYLEKAQLTKVNLELIAWRLSDAKFFHQCLSQLSESGVFQPSLWAYAIKHNDADRLKEFLDGFDAVVQRVGPKFHCAILHVDPVDRFAYEHYDFRPLIVARTHLLGSKRLILNDGLAQQYERLLAILEHQPELEHEQRFALAYYLLLQNRFEDSIAQFSKMDRDKIEMKLQYDCMMTYIDLIEGRWDAADSRARNYEQHPVPRWRDWFSQVRTQSSERKALIAGLPASTNPREDWKTQSSTGILTGARENRNASEGNAQPALDVVQEGNQVLLRYRNLSRVTLNYYLMDVEHLFSRSPFAQQDGGRLNSIEPNLVETKELKQLSATSESTVSVPEKWRSRNVAIEVVGGGLTRQCIVYANSLTVQMASNLGRLQVLTKEGLQPLPGAYVKVYARTSNGQSKFYKDGYTDLRGQFDYATLSTNDLDETQRFAILVIHSEHGTTVRETEPPKR